MVKHIHVPIPNQRSKSASSHVVEEGAVRTALTIMVSGCGKAGRFLDRIEKACDWSALEALRLRRPLSVRCPQ
jgi:hypothetical protein